MSSSPALAMRERVDQLKTAMLASPDQIDLPVEHFFADAVYVRRLALPAGVTLVGKIHKKSHVFIVAKGVVRVVGDGLPIDMEAGDIFVSPVGARRAIHALTDAVLVTAHGTKETDLDALEKNLIAKDFAELEAPQTTPLIEGPQG